MNAVRTPSIVLLFHSYAFSEMFYLRFYKPCFRSMILETFESRISRRASSTSSLRSERNDRKNLTKFIKHAAAILVAFEPSTRRPPHFIYKPCLDLGDGVDPAEFLESFLHVGAVRHGRCSNSPRNVLARPIVANATRAKLSEGVLVTRTFGRSCHVAVTKFPSSRSVETGCTTHRSTQRFHEPDNGAI